MRLFITALKAPWPAGATVGDVVDLPVDEVPGWALGKCREATEDEPVTIGVEAPAPAIVANVVPPSEDDLQAAAALAAAEQQAAEEAAALAAAEQQAAGDKPKKSKGG